MAAAVTSTYDMAPLRNAADDQSPALVRRNWSPIRRARGGGGDHAEDHRLTPRDWSPYRGRACWRDWSPHRRSSSPASPTRPYRDGGSPMRRPAAAVNVSPFGSPSSRSKAEAFASLRRTPDQMVKQADRLIERTQVIMERSALAQRRTEIRLQASRERRAKERLEELTTDEGSGETAGNQPSILRNEFGPIFL